MNTLIPDFTSVPFAKNKAMTLSAEAADAFQTNAVRVAGSGSDEARAEQLWRWATERFDYTPTPRHANLDALLADTGGNCMDHATVLLALCWACRIPARLVREINLQPESESRENTARAAGTEVFGRRHNDHTWVEVGTGSDWIPADSALRVFGTEAWVRDRVERGRVSIYGMIVPLLVVAYENGGVGDGKETNRTHHYLAQEAARFLPSWTTRREWQDWLDEVAFFEECAVSLLGDAPQAMASVLAHQVATGAIIQTLRQ